MRAAAILLAAAMAATPAVADELEISMYCFLFSCNPPQYRFRTDFGSYWIQRGATGCSYNTGEVPGMTELCIDLNNDRAHFKFQHQSFKRCLQHDWSRDSIEDVGEFASWGYRYWPEVPCTWKMPAGDGNATVETISATAETGASAVTKVPVPYTA